jgi:hypothetical protein
VKTLLVVLALAGVAAADPIQAPAGWTPDSAQASELLAKQRGVAHFGGAPSNVAVAVYVPKTPGIVLEVTVVAVPATAQGALRGEINDHERPAKAPGVTVTDSGMKVDDAAKLVESRFAMRDAASRIKTTSRMVVASDGKKLFAVTGDCIATDDSDGKLFDACTAALATLDPPIAPADRVLPKLDDAAPPSEPPPSGGPTLSPRLDDGSHINMPPIVVPQDSHSAPDRRPVYLGLGLVLFALVFWWNRKRRERFEAEDAAKTDDAKPDEVAKEHTNDSEPGREAATIKGERGEPESEPGREAATIQGERGQQ